MQYEPAEPIGPGAGAWGHAGRAVTVVGTRSPLEVAVCRDVPPETAQSLAAEAAAESFAGLGGTAVVLRLGWTYGETDRLSRQILAAAARG